MGDQWIVLDLALSAVSVKCDLYNKGQSCPWVHKMDRLPHQYGNQLGACKPNQWPKATLSLMTGHGPVLNHFSLARCFTTNLEGLGHFSLLHSLYVLNPRHCDHDIWWKTMQSTEKLYTYIHSLLSQHSFNSKTKKNKNFQKTERGKPNSCFHRCWTYWAARVHFVSRSMFVSNTRSPPAWWNQCLNLKVWTNRTTQYTLKTVYHQIKKAAEGRVNLVSDCELKE